MTTVVIQLAQRGSDSGVRLTRNGSSLNQSQMQTPLLS